MVTIHSTVSLLWIVTFFLNQTLNENATLDCTLQHILSFGALYTSSCDLQMLQLLCINTSLDGNYAIYLLHGWGDNTFISFNKIISWLYKLENAIESKFVI